jgi:hypothetical protein
MTASFNNNNNNNNNNNSDHSKDATYLCLPLDNRDIKIYSLQGERLARLPRNNSRGLGHRRLVTSVATCHNLLFSASFDKLINCWSADSSSSSHASYAPLTTKTSSFSIAPHAAATSSSSSSSKVMVNKENSDQLTSSSSTNQQQQQQQQDSHQHTTVAKNSSPPPSSNTNGSRTLTYSASMHSALTTTTTSNSSYSNNPVSSGFQAPQQHSPLTHITNSSGSKASGNALSKLAERIKI